MEEELPDLTGLRGEDDAGPREMVAFPAATDTRRQSADASVSTCAAMGRFPYAWMPRRKSARAWPPAMRKEMSLPQRMNRAPILMYFSMVGWS